MAKIPLDPTAQKLRNLVILVIITVALPSLLLTGFGILAIEGEEQAAILRMNELYQPVVVELAGKINQDFDRLLGESQKPLQQLVAWAKNEIPAPGEEFTRFLSRNAAAVNFFVLDGENRLLLPSESFSDAPSAKESQERRRRDLSARLAAMKSRTAAETPALLEDARELARMLIDPTLPVPRKQVVEIAEQARDFFCDRYQEQDELACARLQVVAKREALLAAVARLRSVSEKPSILPVLLDGQHQVVLVQGSSPLVGFQMMPQAFEVEQNALLAAKGLGGFLQAKVHLSNNRFIYQMEPENRKGKRYQKDWKDERMWAGGAFLLKTGLAWRVDLVYLGGKAMSTLSSSRISMYGWVLGLLVLALVGGIARTVQIVIRESRLSRLKTDFVSSVSHELRTPLTSIRMFTETLLQGRTRSKEDERECLETINQETERLSRLVEQILDFARMEAGRKAYRFEPTELSGVVKTALSACRPLIEEKGFKIETELPEGLPPVSVDRDAMQEVVINLLTNAIKYSPEARRVRIGCRAVQDQLEIAVEDWGVGIDRSDQKKIFDKFYRVDMPQTAAVAGSGLGLSLVKYIVEAHGGQVRVDSAPGKGSTFFVRLPLRSSMTSPTGPHLGAKV